MTRDPGLEEVMRDDLGELPGLSEKPMFGGLCFLAHGNMICAARQGRAMYRVGKSRNDDALALLGTAQLRTLVTSAPLGTTSRSVPGVNMQQFWRYSLNTAKLARSLAGIVHHKDRKSTRLNSSHT